MSRVRGWHILTSSGRTGYVVGAVIAVQVMVPAVVLFHEPPSRFGFQMYSAQGGVFFEAFDEDGEPVDVDLDGIVAGSLRPELDWVDVLPGEVCEHVAEAVQVVVEQSQHRSVVQCG